MRHAFTGRQQNGAAQPAFTFLFEFRKSGSKVC